MNPLEVLIWAGVVIVLVGLTCVAAVLVHTVVNQIRGKS